MCGFYRVGATTMSVDENHDECSKRCSSLVQVQRIRYFAAYSDVKWVQTNNLNIIKLY